MAQFHGDLKMKNEKNKKSFCRLCRSSQLISILKLASTPPANAFVSKDNRHLKQKEYPLELFQRVITISLETKKIVNSLPKLNID